MDDLQQQSTPSISSYYQLIFISLAFLLSTILITTKKSKSSSNGKKKPAFSSGGQYNLPPGPSGWPVVGNLFQFSSSGKQFFEYIRDLQPIYGPIFTLKMGTRNMIIVTDGELAHQALIEKGPIFATRPSENPTRVIFSSNKFTVNAALYGPVWRSLRRNMVQNMLSTSRVKEFREVRDAAMDKYIQRITDEAQANDGAVWVLKNSRFAVFCILLAMCFGVDMDEEAIEQIDQMMKQVLITLDPRIDDYLPILSPFFSKQRKNVLQVRQKQIETLLPHINKRRAVLKNPAIDPKATSFSYLDTLFELKIDGRESGPTDPEIVTLCSEFLNGGTDTTATALEWGVARFIQNPTIQTKLHHEIMSVVGPNRKVDETDLDKMPYLHAFTKELLRKHPPTYFSLTHAVTEPTKLAGYDILPGVNVEFFLPGIAEDPKIWKDPERFEPERFLSGGEDADVTGVTAAKMLPFGGGRRICPGLGMATVHVHLMIARLVQEFEWSAYPDDKTEIDFGEKLEFTVVMKKPLRAKIKSRV